MVRADGDYARLLVFAHTAFDTVTNKPASGFRQCLDSILREGRIGLPDDIAAHTEVTLSHVSKALTPQLVLVFVL